MTTTANGQARTALINLGTPAAARIIAAADRNYGGSIKMALADAREGNLGAEAYSLAFRIRRLAIREAKAKADATA